jgi:phosphoglycerate dehydrogenase-like enzyme
MSSSRPRVAVLPAGTRDFLVRAVEDGGGEARAPEDAEALVWTETTDAAGLAEVLDAHPHIGWVQLPFAGVEPYVDVIRDHADRTWTCGKGVYAEPVAEHALTLALAGRRAIDRYSRARTWTQPQGRNLLGARVTILGGGGITEALLRLLEPFGCDVTVVRSTPHDMPGAARVVAGDHVDEAVTGADLLVVALALTPDTVGIVDGRRLGLLAEGAGLVNVARGQHVVTDDLIPALDGGPLASAGLDVTDPEPLPDDHPLWGRPDVVITPHTANTPEMAVPLLGARVTENVRRFAKDEPLLGPVDPEKGY